LGCGSKKQKRDYTRAAPRRCAPGFYPGHSQINDIVIYCTAQAEKLAKKAAKHVLFICTVFLLQTPALQAA
jgi:hypothetical protein